MKRAVHLWVFSSVSTSFLLVGVQDAVFQGRADKGDVFCCLPAARWAEPKVPAQET